MRSVVPAAKAFIVDQKLGECRILSKNSYERRLALAHTIIVELIKEIERGSMGSNEGQAGPVGRD